MARRRANGEGSVYKRADGYYAAALSYVDPTTGQTRRQTFYAKTATEARKKMRAAMERRESGAPVKDASRTVADWCAQWRATSLAASDRKPATKSLYASLLASHVEGGPVGAITLDRLRATDVESLVVSLRSQGKADSTVRSVYSVLRAAMDDAVRDGLLARNPVSLVKRPKVERKDAAYLTPAQVSGLLSAAEGSRNYFALYLLARTGLRRGEALALRWSDVDLEAQGLRVRGTLGRLDGSLSVTEPKTERARRTVPLSAPLVAALKAHKKHQTEERLKVGTMWHDNDLVLATEFGRHVDPRNLLRSLAAAARAANRPEGIGLHTLRHSFAEMLVGNGVPLRTVADILGHSSITTTGDLYGHRVEDRAHAAVTAVSAALDG